MPCSNGPIYGLAVCKMQCDLLIWQVWCIWILTGRGSSTELKLWDLCYPCLVLRKEGEKPKPMAGLSYYYCADGNIGIYKDVCMYRVYNGILILLIFLLFQ